MFKLFIIFLSASLVFFILGLTILAKISFLPFALATIMAIFAVIFALLNLNTFINIIKTKFFKRKYKYHSKLYFNFSNTDKPYKLIRMIDNKNPVKGFSKEWFVYIPQEKINLSNGFYNKPTKIKINNSYLNKLGIKFLDPQNNTYETSDFELNFIFVKANSNYLLSFNSKNNKFSLSTYEKS